MKAASSQFLTVITKNYESMALKACSSASSWVSYLVKAPSSSSVKDLFDRSHNPSHSTLYPDVLKIKTIIVVKQNFAKKLFT